MTDSKPSTHELTIQWRFIVTAMLTIGVVMVSAATFITPLIVTSETGSFSSAALFYGTGIMAISLLSLLPFYVMTRRDASTFLKAFILSGVLRSVLTLLWSGIAGFALRWDPVTIMLTLFVTYLPLLYSETVYLFRMLSSRRPLESLSPTNHPHQEPLKPVTGSSGTEAMA